MIHFGLFSGIGGFDLASEWMGWKNYLSCEINEFGNKILSYYWPNAYHHKDIHTLDYETINNELSKRFGTDWRNDKIILTGGFPCQPFSLAGKRKGTEDNRHLWPEMLRTVRAIRPDWIVGENVYGIVNWDGGVVFEQVQADLEQEGYEVWPVILPACAVNAPHRRDRVWFVAHTNGNGCERIDGKHEINAGEGGKHALDDAEQVLTTDTENVGQKQSRSTRERWSGFKNNNSCITTDTDSRRQSGKEYRQKESERFAENGIPENWENFPTQSPVCDGNDGISARLDFDAVWGQTIPRKPFITFAKWRNESIKAGGNAIVPQVALQIFKAIEKYEHQSSKKSRKTHL